MEGFLKRDWRKSVPNLLSSLRIVLAFAFPFVPEALRLPIIAIALLSEFFDGFLARRWNAVTPLGILLDPVADKLFVLSTVVTLISEGRLTVLAFFLLAARDITVAIGSLSIIIEKGKQTEPMVPRLSGKIATAFQFVLLIWLFANFPYQRIALNVTIVASVISAIDYLYCVLHRRFDQVPRESH